MKKILCFLIVLTMILALTACEIDFGDGDYSLTKVRQPAAAKKLNYGDHDKVSQKASNVIIPYAADFSAKFLADNANENTLCSPLSAYMALSLLAEITRGASQREILAALHLADVDELRTCADLFYNASNKEYSADGQLISKQTVTNSLWFEPDLAMNEDTLDVLATMHHAFSLATSFSNENAASNRALTDFIYEESNHLLKPNFNIDENTLFLLVNTLYVKDMWNMYSDLYFDNASYTFANSDGSQTTTRLLSYGHVRGELYQTEAYQAFPVTSCNDYRLYFVVPNGGNDIHDVMSANTISNVLTHTYRHYNEDYSERYLTKVLFPEFTVENQLSIANVLKNMGIRTVFSETNADLSGLLADQPGYVPDVLQANKLAVDKKGFEGASVTVIPGAGEAMPMGKPVYFTLTVDRSFGFILADSYNIPLFTGIVLNLK